MPATSRQHRRESPPPAEVAAAMARVLEGDAEQPAEQPAAPLTLRRWEAAETNRLNSGHWARATGQPINADLLADLRTLRARASHEAANNPMVDGVITTHAVDLVGKHGPRLSVVSDDPQYNAALEQLWGDWWAMPDLARELSGVELLALWVQQWWTKGEHLVKITYDLDAAGPLKFRIQNIDPDRLDTSPASAGNPRVVLGVIRDKIGRPRGYEIKKPAPYWLASATEFERFNADQIIHQFRRIDADQARGFPWLASCLPTIADLRDYDAFELDAAKLAASQGVVWYTEHPDAPFMLVSESKTLERNTQRTGPPGWKPMMIDPAHPSNNYLNFRSERLRELGRPVAMPLMKILLGSEKHNFSSARMDGQNYWLALEWIRGWTERGTLNPLVRAVAREAMLVRESGRPLLPPRPRRVRFDWVWQRQPHVDPVKESVADDRRLKNGTLAYRDALAKEGLDEDAVIASRAETASKLEAAGLPPLSETATTR